jgi:hypothetical protein
MEKRLDERGAAPFQLTKARALARHCAAEAEIRSCHEIENITDSQLQNKRLHRLHAALQHATGRRPCELQAGGPDFCLVDGRPYQLTASYLRKQSQQARTFPTLVEAQACLEAIKVLRETKLIGYSRNGKSYKHDRGGANTHKRHTDALFQDPKTSHYSAIRGLYIRMAYETRQRSQFGIEKDSNPTPGWYATQCLCHASKTAKEHYETIIIVD